MPYKVKFDNGTVVSFDNEPTQQDIDDASQHLAQNLKPTPTAEQPKGFFQQVGERIGKVYNETKQNINDIAQRYDTASANNDPTALPAMALSATAAAPKAVVGLAMEGIKQILPQGFKNDMKSFIGTVANNPKVQADVIQPLTTLAQNNPKTAQAIQDVTDIAAVLPGPKSLSEAEKLAIKAAEEAKKVAPIIKDAAVTATEALAKTPEAMDAIKLANQAKIDSIVGQIIQGKPKDIPIAKKALTTIDMSGVKTYSDVPVVLKDHGDALKTSVDNLLKSDTSLYKLPKLKLTTVVGGESVGTNFVNRALTSLKQLYTKTADVEGKTLITQLITKAKTDGLDIDMINKLSREFAQQKAAFNLKTGVPLTGVNATMYENIRTGLKDTIKQLSPQTADAFTALDKEWSNAISTQKLFDKMVTAVNTAEQKVKQVGKVRGVVNKIGSVGAVVGEGVNAVTGNFLPKLMGKFITTTKKAGEMNVMEIQAQLRKNIIKLNKINQDTGGNIFNKLNDLIK